MSEQESRKHTSIRNLREEIRQDMRDFKLLCSEDNEGSSYFSKWVINDRWFSDYLQLEINDNLKKLKELVEQNNE